MKAGSCGLHEGAYTCFNRRVIEGMEGFAEMNGIHSLFVLFLISPSFCVHWTFCSSLTSTSALLTTPKPLTVWITTNCKILQKKGIPDHLTCLLKNLYAGQEVTELGMEQHTGSELGKEYIKAVYCHHPYLTYMRVHHEKSWA